MFTQNKYTCIKHVACKCIQPKENGTKHFSHLEHNIFYFLFNTYFVSKKRHANENVFLA